MLPGQGNSERPWAADRAVLPKNITPDYGATLPGSTVSNQFGSYSPLPGLDVGHYGVIPQQNIAFSNMAQAILGGSQQTNEALMRQYDEMYRHRAMGIAGAQREYSDRLQGEVAAQGYSPDLVRRMLLSGNAQAQAQIGSERAAAKSGYYGDLAGLIKGTSTELAGLGRDELQMIYEAWNAQRGIKAARDAISAQREAAVIGAIGNIVGGAIGGAFGGG